MDVRRADAEWQRAVACAAAAGAAASRPRDGSATDAAVAAGELPLRLRYSLPLIRLVNGISDSQQRGRVASSVAVLSDAAGLPRALVDVRHEATHSELPSLPLLRAAADSALTWLRDNYWDGQSRALAAAAERIGSLLACLANSWRAATAAGLSGSAGALAAAAAAAEEDDDEDGDTDGEAAGGSYSGSEGQRIRRQAMSELRSMVPPAYTHELLQPILDCPVLLPPDLQLAGPAAAAHTLAAPPHRDAAVQQQREVVDARAWRSTMKQLLKWYPRLRPLLLQAALQRLVALGRAPSPAPSSRAPARAPAPAPPGPGGIPTTAGSATPPDSLEQRARVYALWVLRLLPASALASESSSNAQASKLGSALKKQGRAFGAVGSGAASKASKKAAAAAANAAGDEDGGGGGDALLDGPVGCQQLQELLSTAMAAAEAEAATAAANAVPPGHPDSAAPGGLAAAAPEGGAADLPRALTEITAVLQRAIGQASASRGGGVKWPRDGLGEEAAAPEADAGEADEDGGDDDSGQGSGGGNRGVKRQCQQPEQQQQQSRSEPQRRHWQRCAEWSRCAVGCLPCPLNPNGRIPPLMAPPPPPEQQQQRPQQPDALRAQHLGLPGDTADDVVERLGVEEAAANVLGDGSPGGDNKYDEYGDYYMEVLDADRGPAAAGDGGGGGDLRRSQGEPGSETLVEAEDAEEEGEERRAGAPAAFSLFGSLLQQQGPSGAVGFLL